LIGYLDGNVIDVSGESLTVLAGQVGYEVRVLPAVALESPNGCKCRFWIHSAIREQGWDLYGFRHREERDLFRIVQKVPKIGAKTAMAMLAVFEAAALIRIVSDSDVVALSSVPCIGKKTAERVIVELRDILGSMAGEPSTSSGGLVVNEAVQALVGLGYSAADARTKAASAIEAGVSANDIEAMIRHVLTTDS